MRVLGEVFFQPSPALRVGNGVGGNRIHRSKCDSWPGSENESHRNQIFANDAKLWRCGQGILGCTNPTLNAVLNGNHGKVRTARLHVLERLTNVVDADPFAFFGTLDLAQSLPGEGSRRP